MKSETPQPSAAKCWPWSHRWSKWADQSRLTAHPRTGDTESILMVFIVQHRRCEICNMLETRRVKE